MYEPRIFEVGCVCCGHIICARLVNCFRRIAFCSIQSLLHDYQRAPDSFTTEFEVESHRIIVEELQKESRKKSALEFLEETRKKSALEFLEESQNVLWDEYMEAFLQEFYNNVLKECKKKMMEESWKSSRMNPEKIFW